MTAPLPGPEKSRPLLEFDLFRVDPVRRLLLRDGEPVVVTPKAFSILLVLLERQGEVVEKEELLRRVWPDTFVTEANLVQNISSLRKSLGEKANEARYVVTVSGLGYSFMGAAREIERTVERTVRPFPAETEELPEAAVPEAEDAAPEEAPAAPPFPPPPVPPEIEPPPSRPAGRRRLRIAAWAALVAAVLAAVFFGFARFPVSRDGPDATAAAAAAAAFRRSVAVLSLVDLSPDPATRWLGTAFAEMLATELAVGGNVRVIPGDRVAEITRVLSLAPADPLGPRELDKVHDALGADLVLVGSYLAIDGKIRLSVRVVADGEAVASVVETGTEPGLFDLVSRTGLRLRRELGFEDLSPGQEREVQALLPANAEAVRLHAEGLERLRAFDPPGARDLLERAAQADPSSAVIRSALSKAWGDLGVDARAVEEAGKAVDLAGPLPRREKLGIQARFHAARREWDQASQIYRSLWTLFPDDLETGLQLAMSQMAAGRTQEAADTIKELQRLPPPLGDDPRLDLAASRFARRLSDPITQERSAAVAVAKGRRSGQKLLVAQALIYQGDALVILGKPEPATGLYREAREMGAQAGDGWTQGMALANLGVALQRQGDLRGSKAAQEQALVIAQQLGTAAGGAAQQAVLGLLHRDLGDLEEALSLLEKAGAAYEAIGDPTMEARALNALAIVLTDRGDLQELRRTAEKVTAMAKQTGSRADEAAALGHMATVLDWKGDLGAARRLHDSAQTILDGLGDAGAAATALAASAEVSARLGELATARKRIGQALAIKRAAGDRIGAGQLQGLRARLAEMAGDLKGLEGDSREQLALARTSGARLLAAWAQQDLGRAALARGDLAGARRSLDEALRLSIDTGEHLRTAEVRLDLARLALQEGQPETAVDLARQAAVWYASRGIEDEVRAWSIVAEAQLRRGKLAEAREAAARVRAWMPRGEDRELLAAAAAPLARVDAAGGHWKKAIQELEQAVDRARATGFVQHGLEARLALGEVRAAAGDRAAALAALAQVRDDARARNLDGIARRAEAALTSLAGPLPRSL